MAGDQGIVAPPRGGFETLRLLCTNDDGILAHGLACLIEAAEPLGEITVVAPDREQSATSHSLTLHHPVRPIERGPRRFQVDGTPTDCVMLAVEALMPNRPDFVLSGINHGQNMGEDVLYSGTVAAAMEGLSLGIPSVAWSYLLGAARTRLVIEPRRRVGAAVGALLLAAGSLGVPLALLSSPAPANAASVAHSRTAHPRPAHPRPAHPRHGGSRPAGPRYGGGRGAPDRCDRHDHC